MSFLVRAWYNKAPWLWLLWPLSLLFQLLARLRRKQQSANTADTDIPVIVVGNIAVGGTGKTPLLITLCQHLVAQGMQPGIISRGYGAMSNTFPIDLDVNTSAKEAGDEPVLIAEKTGCPVVVDPDRVRALNTLTTNHTVNIVLSDDGLQHYKLPRRIEIIVVDGKRGFGNGLCLPAGPLRESVSRLREVDFLIVNGEENLEIDELKNAHRMLIRSTAMTNGIF